MFSGSVCILIFVLAVSNFGVSIPKIQFAFRRCKDKCDAKMALETSKGKGGGKGKGKGGKDKV